MDNNEAWNLCVEGILRRNDTINTQLGSEEVATVAKQVVDLLIEDRDQRQRARDMMVVNTGIPPEPGDFSNVVEVKDFTGSKGNANWNEENADR